MIPFFTPVKLDADTVPLFERMIQSRKQFSQRPDTRFAETPSRLIDEILHL
jgi:hypothetical protein